MIKERVAVSVSVPEDDEREDVLLGVVIVESSKRIEQIGFYAGIMFMKGISHISLGQIQANQKVQLKKCMQSLRKNGLNFISMLIVKRGRQIFRIVD